jgi:hypothetical protein
MKSAASVPRIKGSSANGMTLWNPPVRSKPALLKAETEWNRPHQVAVNGSRPSMRNAPVRTRKPAPSAMAVKSATRTTSELVRPSSAVPVEACTSIRSRSPVRRPRSVRSMNVDAVMKPRPPIWNRRRIATWPKGLQ